MNNRLQRRIQTPEVECFTKKVSDFKPLIVFVKHPILDVWQGSEYASGLLKISVAVILGEIHKNVWYMPLWL